MSRLEMPLYFREQEPLKLTQIPLDPEKAMRTVVKLSVHLGLSDYYLTHPDQIGVLLTETAKNLDYTSNGYFGVVKFDLTPLLILSGKNTWVMEKMKSGIKTAAELLMAEKPIDVNFDRVGLLEQKNPKLMFIDQVIQSGIRRLTDIRRVVKNDDNLHVKAETPSENEVYHQKGNRLTWSRGEKINVYVLGVNQEELLVLTK
jgi:hypothetical protein